MKDKNGNVYAHVFVNCDELLRGNISIAVATTRKGLDDIQLHIQESDDLFHFRLWQVPKTDKSLSDVAMAMKAQTAQDEKYLQYCRVLAETRLQSRNMAYLRTIYMPDFHGRADDEW